jgi:hypothetical protein
MNRYWLIVLFIFFDLSPCSAADVNQWLANTYKYQETSVPPIRIDSIRVWIHKNTALIAGDVSRVRGYDVDPNDYIDVSVIDPRGKLLSYTRTYYFPKPVGHPSSRKGNPFSSYTVDINFLPPRGSTIKVVYGRLD